MLLNMANNYISIKIVADRLLRHPMMAGISFEAIIDYTIDFMRIVQCGGFFEEKCTKIIIEEYKGLLPEDFYDVNQIRLISQKHKYPIYEEVVRKDEKGNIIIIDGMIPPTMMYEQIGYAEGNYKTNKTFISTSDSFHMSEDKVNTNLTYKIQGGYIFTSIKDGEIELSYKAILVDDELYPVIPDNSKFLRALEAYIKKEWFTILFDMGKLQPAILNNTQQEYAWAVGACESEFHKMSLDKAESFYNSWRTLIPRTNEHSRGFITDNIRQHLKFE